MIIANDGVKIYQSGKFINCSNGDHYHLVGSMLHGPGHILSSHVRSMKEAVGIVVGLHGGKKFMLL